MSHRRNVRVLALLTTCATLLGLTIAAAPVSMADSHPSPSQPSSEVAATDSWLHFAGRWDRHYRGDEAATVNSGSAITLGFLGDGLTAHFDVSTITVAAQIWVTVDSEPRTLVSVDKPDIDLTDPALRPGAHTLRIDVKDTDQVTNRWLPELNTSVAVKGFTLAHHGQLLPPPAAHGPRIAVYGDSITEGIRALGMDLTPIGADGTRSYGSLLARALDADLTLVGFGKTGVMRPGVGNVPSAPESFGLNFQGSPAATSPAPDVIVLLQGSNDSQVTEEQFAPAYLDFLRQVRASAPHAWILAMQPLIGRHGDVIKSDVATLADDRIAYVSTDGWLDRSNTDEYTDTVHPTVAGHLIVAEHLIPIVHETTGLTIEGSAALVTVPAVTATADTSSDVSVTVHIDQAWNSRQSTRGSIVIDPPAGFTAAQNRTPYDVGSDGKTDVTVTLHGMIAAGTSVAGTVRVLVDGQTETLPAPLTINAG